MNSECNPFAQGLAANPVISFPANQADLAVPRTGKPEQTFSEAGQHHNLPFAVCRPQQADSQLLQERKTIKGWTPLLLSLWLPSQRD